MEGPHLEMRADDGVLDATVFTIEQNIFVFLCMCKLLSMTNDTNICKIY